MPLEHIVFDKAGIQVLRTRANVVFSHLSRLFFGRACIVLRFV